MKILGQTNLLGGLLVGLSAITLLTACSNNNFRGESQQAATEEAASSSEDAQQEDGITTSPIGSTELTVPGALKSRPDSLFAAFPTSTIKDANFQFALDLKGVTNSIKLEDRNTPKTENFTQNVRTQVSNPFKQGNPGLAMTDNFDQVGKKGLVDILVVIDNSGSMVEEQTNLSTKLNELLVSIKDANWQISIITTAPAVPAGVNMNDAGSEGKELCNTTVIKTGDADAATKFAAAVNAGTNGNGNEQGIRQSVVGLRCTEKPWLRAGASLAVLIISDEDNCSLDGLDCGTLPWAKETYLTAYAENVLKRTIGKDTGFYGIVAPSKALCATAGNEAPQYIRLFNYKSTAGANFGNICDASYKTTLNQISNNIALLLTSTFELKNQPDAGSLALTVQSPAGVVTPVDPSSFTLVNKTITFTPGKEPANGSKLIANYRVGATPMFSAVTLINDPAPGTISVKINGATLGAGGFTSSGRVVTFATQPAATADIVVDYRLNTALFDRFKLAAEPLAGTLSVKIANVAVNNFTYDAAKGEISFAQIPTDGQIVQAIYTFREGPILSYKVPLMAGAKNFKLLDGTTAVNFTQTVDVFTITAAQHQAGKTLTLSYEIPDGAARTFALGETPLPNTTKIEMQAGTCSLGNGISIANTTLTANCPVTEKTEFTLTFKYRAAQKTFALTGIKDPELGVWAVYYNGQATSDYTRTGSSIQLNFDPDLDSKVDISYTFPE